MDVSGQTPIIVSNWFQWLATTILSGLGAAIVFLFHNKADRDELKAGMAAVQQVNQSLREDMRELRTALLSKAFLDDKRR